MQDIIYNKRKSVERLFLIIMINKIKSKRFEA